MTPNQTEVMGHQKYLPHLHNRPRVQNFCPFWTTINRFRDIPHFRFSHWLSDVRRRPYVKISKCYKIFKPWPTAKKSDSLYFTMVVQCPHTWFGWHQMKTVGGIAAPYGPVLRKMSKCHKIFIFFWQIAKISMTLYSPMTAVFVIKFGPNRMKTVGVVFCNF